MVASGVRVIRAGHDAVFGAEHPAVALGANQLTDDRLAGAAGVVPRRVDVAPARLRELLNNASARRARGAPGSALIAEHDRAETHLGHSQPAPAQQSVAHGR